MSDGCKDLSVCSQDEAKDSSDDGACIKLSCCAGKYYTSLHYNLAYHPLHPSSTAIMKSLISTLFLSTLTLATPTRRATSSDTSTDIDDVLADRKSCAPTAVIFGRGTFDSGNIGVWTGPQFKDALIKELDGDVHFQGVNREDYPANLDGYAREGGSESCADACAETVDAYAEKCPEAKIFVSGWRFVFNHSLVGPSFQKGNH